MPAKAQTFLSYALLLMVCSTAASASSLAEIRADFLQAEQYIRLHRDAQYLELAEHLTDYSLYPYLQYQWLKSNLDQNRAIERFLSEQQDTRYAGLLRSHWLQHLAKNKNWSKLVKHYRQSTNAALQCDYYWGVYQAGRKKTALKAAKKLWVVGYSQPENCDPLFNALKKSKYFTREMLWRRFEAALRKGNVQLATYVKGLMNQKDSAVAELSIDVHRKPELVKKAGWHNGVSHAGEIFTHAVDRVANYNSSIAADIWDHYKHQYTIPRERYQRIERRLALGLAFRRDKQAYSRLEKLSNADETVREWRVRAALSEQNWQHVATSLQQLSSEEKQKINWQYWQARVYDQSGQDEQARNLFNRLADDRSFYGFLSAYKLNRDIQINDKPVPVTEAQIAALARTNDFNMVAELREIGRNQEAKRQWWYAVSKLETDDILLAAKLAQQWQWDQVAIFTIAKAQYWDDVDLRFPVKYTTQVKRNAKRQELDPSIVFGLIRQESAFDENARSPVGARGLMQIMPKTGKQIARDLKEKWKTESSLFNPDVNVKYGTFYYKQLLEQFDGNYALAAAAYNAGPHRVKRWLPDDKAVAADIWIETIPFKETRAYVSAVLTYALIYQQRMQRNALKIQDFLRDILPD